MSDAGFTVFIVDDDDRVLRALSRLVIEAGFPTRAYSSAQAFLDDHDPVVRGCAVLDVAMPGLDGFRLQRMLSADHICRPIIFITGRGDIPMSVRAMRDGAIDFLTKPVDADDLLSAVERARAVETDALRARGEIELIEANLASLTPRERQVLPYVIAGRLNKQIAGTLGTVEKTIKVHRARMMRKLGVRTVQDLVRLAELVGIDPAEAA
jgi:FixJ family two-component response regulator